MDGWMDETMQNDVVTKHDEMMQHDGIKLRFLLLSTNTMLLMKMSEVRNGERRGGDTKGWARKDKKGKKKKSGDTEGWTCTHT